MKAFPLSNMAGLNQPGMDLRDFFAAQAMQALIGGRRAGDLEQGGYVAVSMMSYKMADVMMKARER
jgi:hypothetical protein